MGFPKPIHSLVVLFALICCSFPTVHANADTPRRLNILWLIAEDFGPDLGCYGAKQVWSPKKVK